MARGRRHRHPGPRRPALTGVPWAPSGYPAPMKLLRGVAVAGIAKKVYDEARKPHNQAKIRSAVEKAKARRGKRA